ncbi:unnamed protein product [Amoebophrya sp. A25]|nr:unnamed protein product [Amoebophrya sp. A25]|eukprot:GSA25T00017888001.1
MSEHLRRIVHRDPPAWTGIKFRCAKLHRVVDSTGEATSHYNTIYDVLKSRGWKEWGAPANVTAMGAGGGGGAASSTTASTRGQQGQQQQTDVGEMGNNSCADNDELQNATTVASQQQHTSAVTNSTAASATTSAGTATAAPLSRADRDGMKQDWHIFWADKDWIHSELEKLHLEPHQKVNHFRNHYEITRKDLLSKNVKRHKRMLEREGRWEEAAKYNVLPVTFVLPQEYSMFVEEFRRVGGVWIMKPVGRSQGTGIFMVTKLSQIQQWKPAESSAIGGGYGRGAGGGRGNKDHGDAMLHDEEGPEAYIVQKYIEKPLLIGGRKFDLRIYALVTGYQPLTVWLSREGFARFSLTRYSADSVRDPAKLSSHLTNVAVQKNLFSKDNTYQRTGGKWEIPRMKQYLINKIGRERTKDLFLQFEDIIIYSLLAVQKVIIADRHCFEMYGFDIMIDADYRAILIEVNASPSLTANTKADYDMKFGTLDDLLTILDFEKYLSGSETRVGGFDLIYKGGPVPGHTESMLGTRNDRQESLKKLAQEVQLRALVGVNGKAEGG